MRKINFCKRLSILLAVVLTITSVICFTGSKSVFADTTEQFIYDTDANGNLILAGYSGTGTDLEIPEAVNGKKVISVKADAFKGCKTITSVKFPETVTTIGNNAFLDCSGLKSVTMTDKITAIGTCAFKNCTALESITFPATMTTISESICESCLSLTSVTIPSSVTTVNKKAFFNCPNLGQVYLSDKVTTIGEMAFGYYYDSNKGKSVPNPNFVINCAEGSKAYEYASKEGFLINTTDKWTYEENDSGITIIAHTGYKKDLKIPEKIDGKKVTKIGESAFYEDTLIESVTVPNGITTIGRWAFKGCTNLKHVILPDSITSIGNKAFDETVEVVCCSEKVFKLYGWSSKTTRHKYDNDKDHVCNVCGFDKTAPTPTPTVDPAAFVTTTPPAFPASELSVGDFVTRCYKVALDREPDEAGYASWCDKLNNGKACGAQVGYGFIFAQEYSNKKTTNEQFVKDLYAMFFGREPDNEGYNYWLGLLNKNETREKVFAGFANSQEFTILCEKYGVVSGHYVVGVNNDQQGEVNCFVARLYRICLNRLPDAGSQAIWVDKLLAGTETGTSCAKAFALSKELSDKKLSNADFVAYMYRAFFGREADDAGLQNWVTQLVRGESRSKVFDGFANSDEFANLCKQYGIKVK
ncbi:MAG: DUF4214 domain-containing protein [Clostridia bacterium]|nr:DUF4214 domain-containing protein [Clostridia bacterium]